MKGHRSHQVTRALEGHAISLSNVFLMFPDLVQHGRSRHQPAYHIGRDARIGFHKSLCRRTEQLQIVFQAALNRNRGPRYLPAAENFFGHQLFKPFQITHMLVQRHLADTQSGRYPHKSDVGQANLNASVGNPCSGDGGRTSAWRGRLRGWHIYVDPFDDSSAVVPATASYLIYETLLIRSLVYIHDN